MKSLILGTLLMLTFAKASNHEHEAINDAKTAEESFKGVPSEGEWPKIEDYIKPLRPVEPDQLEADVINKCQEETKYYRCADPIPTTTVFCLERNFGGPRQFSTACTMSLNTIFKYWSEEEQRRLRGGK